MLNQFDDLDNDALNSSMNRQNYLSTKRFESTQLYLKPERIENECLMAQRNAENIGMTEMQRGLRENLAEHYDFEALFPSIWLHLYSWYSADTQIARYLRQDALKEENNLMNS